MERIRTAAIQAWIRLKHEELGAQTLEWLALALLILGLLAVAAPAVTGVNVADALKAKFIELIDKIK